LTETPSRWQIAIEAIPQVSKGSRVLRELTAQGSTH